MSGWIDFNRDGDWNDAGEQILVDQSVIAGSNSFTISVPASFSGGTSFARFRLSTQSGLGPTGYANDGEVEDYRVVLAVSPTEIVLSNSVVSENLPVETTVGTFASTDVNADDTFTYSLVNGTGDADNASFSIVGNQLKTAAAFDFETKSSYSIRVRTTDSAGLSFERSFTISVTDLDETAPTVLSLSPSLASGVLVTGTTSFTLTFSEIVLGGGSSGNFELRGQGPDGILGNTDDVLVVTTATSSAVTTTLSFSAIPEGTYRLSVMDTITDISGNLLDGNLNGVAGGTARYDFVVIPVSNLLSARTTYATGSAPQGIATGDFNRDGKQDVVVTNSNANNLMLSFGDGMGGFGPAVTVSSGGQYPISVVVDDFNSDGIDDIAVGNYYSDTVSVIIGNSSGGFANPQQVSTGFGSPHSLTIGDFNSDGIKDIAVAMRLSNVISLLIGNGAGGFATPVTFASGGVEP